MIIIIKRIFVCHFPFQLCKTDWLFFCYDFIIYHGTQQKNTKDYSLDDPTDDDYDREGEKQQGIVIMMVMY